MKTVNYKRDFLDYVLYHYDFQDRVAVWILNFIKTHPTIVNFVSFTDITIDRKLRIAEEDTKRPTLVFEKGSIVTTDGEVIFHELNINDDQPLYLEFAFDIPEKRYDDIKNVEQNSEYGHVNHQIKNLEEEIDSALLNNDRNLFYKLTEELKKVRSTER